MAGSWARTCTRTTWCTAPARPRSRGTGVSRWRRIPRIQPERDGRYRCTAVGGAVRSSTGSGARFPRRAVSAGTGSFDAAADERQNKRQNERDGGIAAGPLSACAVSAAFTLAPGERRNVTFAAAWDLPASSFPRGVTWAKRYTRYHGSFIHRRDVPRGAAAPDIATEALLRADEWEGDIARWQRGFVQSAAKRMPT